MKYYKNYIETQLFINQINIFPNFNKKLDKKNWNSFCCAEVVWEAVPQTKTVTTKYFVANATLLLLFVTSSYLVIFFYKTCHKDQHFIFKSVE